MAAPDWMTTEVTVAKWLKKERDAVEKDEPVAEVEGAKVTYEVKAPVSGVLGKILVSEGTVVPVGEPIALIAEAGEALPEAVAAEEVRPSAEETRITPAARRLAEEHKIDYNKVKGTGPEGTIVREDIFRTVEEVKVELQAKGPRVSGVVPLVGIKKTIAERMAYSSRTTARVTMNMDVDLTELTRLRERLLQDFEKRIGTRLSYTDILVKATAQALKEHPLLNSTLQEDKIVLFEDINVGVAVAVNEDLIVPVVRNADRRSLEEISLAIKDLAEKARANKLSIEDVTDGTFTVSNLGMFGVDTFTPVITPPESALLGVGRIVKKAVVVEDQIVAKPVLSLCLSFDHRIINGAQAAQFLQRLREILESPHILTG